MNILLTGGAGYIGSHLAVVLLRLGHQVVLYDNLSNSSEKVLTKLAQITGQDITLIRGDVRHTNLLIETLQKYHVSAVVHLAGLKAVGESVEMPMAYYAHNVQGTISLLQAMQVESVRILVFSSSATVYGQPQYLPLDESHPTSAVNPYGRSKLHIEEMLADLAKADPEWRIACLRYFNPVGAHESGLIGDKPQGIPNNLMPYITQVAAGQRPYLKVFGNDYPTVDGTCRRDYIHIMDLVEGHAVTLNFLASNTGWQAINLGSEQAYSVLEIIRAFELASGRKVPYQFVPRRSGDVPVSYAQAQKAKQLLSWVAQHTLDDICVSAWHFQQLTAIDAQTNL